jgi:hypothetical protein
MYVSPLHDLSRRLMNQAGYTSQKTTHRSTGPPSSPITPTLTLPSNLPNYRLCAEHRLRLPSRVRPKKDHTGVLCLKSVSQTNER